MKLKFTKGAVMCAEQVVKNKGDYKSRVTIRLVKSLLKTLADGKDGGELEIGEHEGNLLLERVNDQAANNGVPGGLCQEFAELLDAIEPLEKK